MAANRMRKHNRVTRVKRAERLEPRWPLAGLVTAELLGNGSLTIRGDAEANQVGVFLEGEEIVVSALDGTTTINGASELRWDAALLQGDLRIDMKQGNDVVRVGGETHEEPVPPASLEADDDHEEPRLSIPGHVKIATGIGSDMVSLSFTQIGGGLFVNAMGDVDVLDAAEGLAADLQTLPEEFFSPAGGILGEAAVEGDDTPEVDDAVNIGRGPAFRTSGHSDDHDDGHLTGLTSAPDEISDDCGDSGEGGPPADVQVGGGIFILTGPGQDAVKVAFAKVGGSLRVLAGPGADYVVTGRGPLHGIHGGGGGDEGGCGGGHEIVTMAEDEPGGHQGMRPVDLRVAQDLRINLGPGDDFTMLRNTKVGNDLTIAALPGNDSVGAQNVRVVGDTSIITHRGTDFVALMSSEFGGALAIDMGAGADRVLLDSVRVGGLCEVDTGRDADQLAIAASTFFNELILDGGRGIDGLGLGEGEMGNDFAILPLTVLSFEVLDADLVDAVLGAAIERFGAFMQGR